ncbi:hypothetical protein LJY25_03585 [Hymenobacter sp. BT175]|uniref:hypothetical protein n=1 Tax=Hymenobacter translucens TaxID=2886507 RepID=UPI001D0EF21D|nr:hypothetical protein [Hymenobacter translucens]MCC2545513.1 hypothetical protein [Hymenobacter translucens]
MLFVSLAALATALFLGWWLACKRAKQKVAVKRLSITVSDGVALVTLPTEYEMEDLGVLWEFLTGEGATEARSHVHCLIYDCSQWEWANVLGTEMMLWQAEPSWPGDTVFCHMSEEWKTTLASLLEQPEGEQLVFRPALYFDTLAEALTYAQSKKT